MMYKPSSGRMWDPSVLWHEGNYYMFAMHNPGERQRNVWGAISPDGVHWRDLGPVIENAPFDIWKMFVFRHGERFIMNHGSFSRPGSPNDTLRYWESTDLVHWQYLGEPLDTHPDSRWYTNARWDHMYVVPKEDGSGYWGYCVACPTCGRQQSPDGVRWEVLPPLEIDWGGLPAGCFEHSGCRKIGDKYYLLGGISRYMGNWSYGVYTLTAQTPEGPFRPDTDAYRLCGCSGQEGVWGVHFLAAMAQGDNELLISNYIDLGGPNVWMIPLKKAVIDSQGHLRLAYWPQNELAKGRGLALDLSTMQADFAPSPQGAVSAATMAATPRGAQLCPSGFAPSGFYNDWQMISMLPDTFDFDGGAILEGTLRVPHPESPRRPLYAGFVFETSPGQGRTILLEAAHPTCRNSHVGQADWSGGRFDFRSMDVTGPGSATVTGLDYDVEHRFRLWVRQGMFDLYIDDRLMQSFVTGPTTGRLGLFAQNAPANFANLQAWSMSLG